MEKDDIKQTIAKFHNFILERDLTLKEIGLYLKISHSAVAYILQGKTKRPHPRTLYKIKKLIGEIHDQPSA